MIAGKDAANHGEAKNSWHTGTAAYNFVAISHRRLGVRPQFDGLLVDPCIPADWDGFKVTRRFRNADYVIEVKNPDHVQKGVKSATVDGKPIQGNIIPVFEDGREH